MAGLYARPRRGRFCAMDKIFIPEASAALVGRRPWREEEAFAHGNPGVDHPPPMRKGWR